MFVCLLQVLTHDGATVRGKDDIMTKLTSIVELHKAFGMSYRAAHTDFTPWFEVCGSINTAVYVAWDMLSDSCSYMSAY